MKINYLFLLAVRYLFHRKWATLISAFAIGISLVFLIIIGGVNFAIKKAAGEKSIKYPLIIASSGTSSMQAIMSTIQCVYLC